MNSSVHMLSEVMAGSMATADGTADVALRLTYKPRDPHARRPESGGRFRQAVPAGLAAARYLLSAGQQPGDRRHAVRNHDPVETRCSPTDRPGRVASGDFVLAAYACSAKKGQGGSRPPISGPVRK